MPNIELIGLFAAHFIAGIAILVGIGLLVAFVYRLISISVDFVLLVFAKFFRSS